MATNEEVVERAMRNLIRHNIETYGHHISLITGEASPRFAYTVGLTGAIGAELVLGGAIIFSAEQVKQILNTAAELLRAGTTFDDEFEVTECGNFAFRPVCEQWVQSLLLGALDYYKGRKLTAYQIVPDEDHWTVDIPDLEEPATELAWRWFRDEWPFPVPRHSIATTISTRFAANQ